MTNALVTCVVDHGNSVQHFSGVNGIRITGLEEFKDGDRLIMIIHSVVNTAARNTFPTKLPFLFGSG